MWIEAIKIICWVSAASIVYSYLVYPVIIYASARLFGSSAKWPLPDAEDDAHLPIISLLIAAHNEESVIQRRIENALEMQYPPEKLDIVIASDGSADRTVEIAGRFADRGVRLLDRQPRSGKANALNATIPQLPGSIILLSDANTFTEPFAARALVRWFNDPSVGSTVGRLILTDPISGKNVDSLYWTYETFLKKQESRLGALLGANGAIYGIRKELFCPIPDNTIVDDFVIPLLIKQKYGTQIIYDSDAIAHEDSAPDVAGEFRRRSRIGAGGWQAIGILWRLLNPTRGWIFFAFVSHKILRWMCPFFMILALVGSAVLWRLLLYRTLLIGQICFYVAATVGSHLPRSFPLAKIFRLANMFVGMNVALLVGFFRWARGPQTGMWKRTRRIGES